MKVKRDPSVLRNLTQQNSILTPNFGHTAKGFGSKCEMKNLSMLSVKEQQQMQPREFIESRRITEIGQNEGSSDADKKDSPQIQITGQKISNGGDQQASSSKPRIQASDCDGSSISDKPCFTLTDQLRLSNDPKLTTVFPNNDYK